MVCGKQIHLNSKTTSDIFYTPEKRKHIGIWLNTPKGLSKTKISFKK